MIVSLRVEERNSSEMVGCAQQSGDYLKVLISLPLSPHATIVISQHHFDRRHILRPSP